MKNTMIRVIAIAILGLQINVVYAASKVDSFVIPPAHVLTADFKQTRHLTGLPQPIMSSGKIELWSDKGLAWHTVQPFDNTLIISKAGMFRFDAKQNKTNILPAQLAEKENKVFDLIGKMFAGEFEQCLSDFDLQDLSKAENDVRIRLTPKNQQMQKFIKHIEISGSKYISKVVVSRPNGDYDEIELNNHVINAADAMRWQYD